MTLIGYLDPGSGSMLLQILVGGIAGVGVVAKYYGRSLWRCILPEKPTAVEERESQELQPVQLN